MRKQRLVILGYGQRGSIYARYAIDNPTEFEVVAIVENSEKNLVRARQNHKCPIFTDYRDFLKANIEADIVAVATQDADHREHAIACMEKGYDLLLEKPIANNIEDCEAIYEASVKYNRKVIICHVLRYTPFYRKIKSIIQSGLLGDIVTVTASENVGYYHQSHSFVRGPWRNKEIACPMIVAKCCHDLDILRWLIGEKCQRVSSMGTLSHFTEKNAPEGSTQYCTDCKVENCIYRAKNVYQEWKWMRGYFCTDVYDDEQANELLRYSQYDKCVYRTDNNVVDHQVTTFQFDKNITAMHSMTAFSKEVYRDIKIHGTKAELVGSDMGKPVLEVRVFGGETITYDFSDANLSGNHGGGDVGLMHALYLERNGVAVDGLTYIDVSIDSHRMAFGAEQSRLEGKVIDIK
ncbi:MAG: Gfo/Idh/MocA family oxidoreductase [Clostridia bacterium]|nr:Gfo/Idh/MocA family oxidoreductase [Clostridia bacterium]